MSVACGVLHYMLRSTHASTLAVKQVHLCPTTMELGQLFPRFIATRKAIRNGEALWELSDEARANAGYLEATSFNRLQNLLSVGLASPVILATSTAKLKIEKLLGYESSHVHCDLNWLAELWTHATPLLLAAVTPYAIVWLTVTTLGIKRNANAEAMRAYKYKNAATTLVTKAVFLSLFAVLLTCAAMSFEISRFLDGTGGLGILGAIANPAEEIAMYYEVIAAPIVIGATLLAAPIFFYLRFLFRYSAWAKARFKDDGNRRSTGAVVAMLAAMAISIGACVLFALSAVVPSLGAEVIYISACSNLGLFGF